MNISLTPTDIDAMYSLSGGPSCLIPKASARRLVTAGLVRLTATKGWQKWYDLTPAGIDALAVIDSPSIP